jgi:hypothetical protein
VADRKSALAQQRLSLRGSQPRLEHRQARLLVEFDQRVHPPQV